MSIRDVYFNKRLTRRIRIVGFVFGLPNTFFKYDDGVTRFRDFGPIRIWY